MKLFLKHLSHIKSGSLLPRPQKLDRRQLRSVKDPKFHQPIETSHFTATTSRNRQPWQRLARQWGLKCVGLFGSVVLSQIAIAPNAQAATSTLNFSSVPTKVSTGGGADISATGAAANTYRVGDVYRFANVFGGIDALVTIQGTVGNAKLRILDDNTNTLDRKSTRLNSSHRNTSRMPSSA